MMRWLKCFLGQVTIKKAPADVRLRTLTAVKASQSEWHSTKPQHEDIAEIIDRAIDLERVLYRGGPFSEELFALRKALQSVFGHEYGDE